MNKHTAVVYGATGLTGNHLVQTMSRDDRFDEIFAASRTPSKNLPQNVRYLPFDANHISVPENIDVVFCALGTTIKKAGSREAFEAIDYATVTKLAELYDQKQVKNFILISSLGADSQSKNFYLRTKGRADEKVQALNFPRLHIVRPSLLLGKRDENRPLEKISQWLLGPLTGLFIGRFLKYRPIYSSQLAKVMIELVFEASPNTIIESDELHQMIRKYNF